MTRALLLSTACAAVVAAAVSCSPKGEAEPEIHILHPAEGTSVDSTTVIVTITIERFELSPVVYDPPPEWSAETPAEPFKGHWHLYTLAPGASGFTFRGDQFATEAVLDDLQAGDWLVAAELVNQNHVPVYSTPVSIIGFTIPGDARAIRITAPGEGDVHESSSLPVTVDIDNFTLDPDAAGGPNADDTGHWHLVTGSTWTGPVVAEGLALDALATDLNTEDAGSTSISLWAVLANNDHTPVDPPVFDRVQVTVPTTAPRIHLVEPLPGDAVPATFDAFVEVANFALVDPAGAVGDTAGQGHWHVLIDGVDQDVHAYSTSALGLALPANEADVRVELRSNLHAPLAPPVVDVSRVTLLP